MRVLLIDASPKPRGSASGYLRDAAARRSAGDMIVEKADIRGSTATEEILPSLRESDAWVFFAPLYVDALPAHLLSRMTELADLGKEFRGKIVAGVINCGFYEGSQARIALEILENWASRMSARFAGGVGIGGGPALQAMPASDRGPAGPAFSAMDRLLERLRTDSADAENAFVNLAFPRFLYKLAGEAGWRRAIRANGGKPGDLGSRPGE